MKWTPDDHGCIYDETGCFARLTPNKAERLASRHNADIDALTAERDRLIAELRAEKNYAEVDANKYRAEMMTANATLDRLRKAVPPPENMYYCLRCQEYIVPDCEEHCETCGTYVGRGVIEALQDILYPKEINNDLG